LFFAHQVTTNACATQAVLSVVLNAVGVTNGENSADTNATEVKAGVEEGRTGHDTAAAAPLLPRLTLADLGPILTEFRAFVGEFPPHLRGVAISSSAELRAAHNSFRPSADSFLSADQYFDHKARDKQGEAFHFVAYVPVLGTVYELDGLQQGPIVVGPVPTPGKGGGDGTTTTVAASCDAMESSWLAVARQAIQERMTAVGADAGAVKFNLLALGRDLTAYYQSLLEADPNDWQAATWLQEHEQQRSEWKRENERRRHNYVALAIAVLAELAKHQTTESSSVAAVEDRSHGAVNGAAMDNAEATTTATTATNSRPIWNDLLQQARDKQTARRVLQRSSSQQRRKKDAP
jgi:ubiquitin carboxyl-terminal hydrolase L5